MTREEAEKRKIVLYDRGEIVINARMMTEEVKYHKDLLKILSDLKFFILSEHEQINLEQISSDWLKVTIDRFLHPEKYIISEDNDKNTSFFELMDLYLSKKSFSKDYTVS